MVVVVNLEEDATCPKADHARAYRLDRLRASILKANASQPENGIDDSQRRDPNDSGFSAALTCYP